jgi:hypothetical protein
MKSPFWFRHEGASQSQTDGIFHAVPDPMLAAYRLDGNVPQQKIGFAPVSRLLRGAPNVVVSAHEPGRGCSVLEESVIRSEADISGSCSPAT